MKKFLLFTPHLFWLLLTVAIIETGLFKSIAELGIYLFLSLIIHLILEMKRNRLLSNDQKLTGLRIALYITANILLGFFAGILYLFLLPVIYFMTHPLGYMDPGFTAIEAYLFIGYFAIWILTNTLILRVNSKGSIILFLISPVTMIVIPIALVLGHRLT
jgi:hypothetical protein